MSFPSDEFYMRRAIALASRVRNGAFSNPPVGAIVVNNSKIVGKGAHQGPGTGHAEVVALEEAGAKAKGGVLYVTLEPCNHYGKTPPCVDAILRAGIKRVVVACPDLNRRVVGGGIKRLQEAGVEVEVGVCRELGEKLIEAWQNAVCYGVPFVTLKLAMSQDYKIAFANNQPQWLSGSIARAQVQRLRSRVDAILVGKGTVLADNPRLTNRSGRGKDPLKVVLSARGDLPGGLRIYNSAKPVIICTEDASFEQRQFLSNCNSEVVVQSHSGPVELSQALAYLGKRGIVSLLCEGGAEVAHTLVQYRLANRVLLYQTPHLIGEGGVSLSEFFQGEKRLVGYQEKSKRRVGSDTLLTYELC